MKYNYSNLLKSSWKLFNLKGADRLLKQTLDLKLSSNEFNFDLLDFPRTRKYVSSSMKRIAQTCYKGCSNVKTLEFIKGTEDKLLGFHGIKTTLSPSPSLSKYLSKLNFNKLVSFYYDHFIKYPKGRKFYVQNKKEYKLLKNKKGFSSTWYKLQLNDILLSLENFGFIRWVKLQKNLSLKELDKTKKLHSLMRIKGEADYSKELISAKWFFSSFEEVLKNNPYLWLSTLNSWCPKYFDLKYIKVIKSIFTLQKLIAQNITHGPLQNVWIESPKGKYRLICVPDFAYRWYCRMWNDALSVWCKPRIHSNYHGFIYNKGCLSWWKHFISQNWEKYDNIYEFDMASFFPNVNKKEGYEALIYFGVPKTYATHIINLVSGEIKESKNYLDAACFYEETLNRNYRLTNRNLPMGNALCPLISTLVLYKHFDELGFNVDRHLIITGYADDNMLLCTKEGYLELQEMIKHSGKNTLEEFLSDEEKGILIEPDKSGWIKQWGRVLKDLKNLGLSLNLKTSTLRGSTRGTDKNKPSILELKLETQSSRINYSFLKIPQNLEKYFGFLQSRLYIGSWTYEVEQNFYLELDKESFGYKFGKFNWYNRKKYQLTIRNFTSYLNAKLFRFLIFKKRTFSLRNKIWQGANIPCWKEGNDKLYFKKYKEMSIQISQLKFEETWLFYRLKLNGLYVSSSSPLKIISAPKII